MSLANVFELMEEALKDLSSSEIKVLKAVAVSQREQNSTRAGQVKLWGALYCLLENEKYRRKTALKKQGAEIFGEVTTQWTGRSDPDNAVNIDPLELLQDDEDE